MIHERLKDLRKRIGISQADLATQLDLDTSLISRWEKGEREPSSQQAVDLARVLGVSVDFLLNAPSQPAAFKFRSSKGSDAEETHEMRKLLSDAEQQLYFLQEAFRRTNHSIFPSTLQFDLQSIPDPDLPAFVDELRGTLQLNRYVTLDELKQALAERRMHIFEWNMPTRISGLSYRGAFTAIFINRTHGRERQLFTLAHELAHVLFHLGPQKDTSTVSTFGARHPDEKMANRFAAELLMPSALLDDALKRLSHPPQNSSELEQLATLFNVSRDAIFYRLVERGLFSWLDRDRFFTKQTPVERQILARIDDIAAGHVASDFLAKALQIYDGGGISAGKLSEWLFASRLQTEEYLSQRALESELLIV